MYVRENVCCIEEIDVLEVADRALAVVSLENSGAEDWLVYTALRKALDILAAIICGVVAAGQVELYRVDSDGELQLLGFVLDQIHRELRYVPTRVDAEEPDER
jgi:hypothetical protein